MKKLFFTIISIVALVSCDKKEVAQQGKAPVLEQKTETPKIEVQIISESNIPPEMGAGCYYAKTEEEYHQEQYIVLQDGQFLYMQINGVLEKFNIPEPPQEEEAPLDEQPLVEKYRNKNYEITIKMIETQPAAEETGSFYKGTISVKHLKSNATTSVDFYGYCGC